MSDETTNYAQAGVDYDVMDEAKRLGQAAARTTENVLMDRGYGVVAASRGESAFVIDLGDRYMAMTPEGLGTKNIVADALGRKGYVYYYALGRDTVAMIVNDIITVGARPAVVSPIWETGSSEWFANQERVKALMYGWADACIEAGAVFGAGETATLKGIIYPETIVLSGAGVGFIEPKERLTLGDKIRPDDHIVLIESSGVHANGLTHVREVATKLPEGYDTRLPNGKKFGDAILTPTHIYAALQQAIFEQGVDIHYMVNITGHGWRKLMRATQPYTYRMHTTPTVQEEFRFIQQVSGLSDRSMHETFNMGAGFAFIVPPNDAQTVVDISHRLSYKAWDAGVVEEGEKQVIIEPLGIMYGEKELNIR